jgi:hypothetical protein
MRIMGVDDKKVQMLIDKAIAMYEGKMGGIVNDLTAALLYIIDERRGTCENYDYAAADHYLNMRAYVATIGEVGALLAVPMILVYDFAKVIDLGIKELIGRKLMPSTNSDPCPPTGPSFGVMKWALKGVADGLVDFNLRIGKPSDARRPLY